MSSVGLCSITWAQDRNFVLPSKLICNHLSVGEWFQDLWGDKSPLLLKLLRDSIVRQPSVSASSEGPGYLHLCLIIWGLWNLIHWELEVLHWADALFLCVKFICSCGKMKERKCLWMIFFPFDIKPNIFIWVKMCNSQDQWKIYKGKHTSCLACCGNTNVEGKLFSVLILFPRVTVKWRCVITTLVVKMFLLHLERKE